MDLLLKAAVFGSVVQRILGDNLFYQGYAEYESLPGIQAGSSANYPYITNTNSLSDGVSSTSAYSTTSPRFPYYHGGVASVSDRYLHFTEYAADAASQGVSLAGQGDAEVEAARLKLTATRNYRLQPPPTKTFPVYAAIKWNPSHFAIQSGETYQIAVSDTANGTPQYWQDGGIRVTADGYPSYFDSISNCYVGMGRCRSHLKKKRRIPTANWLSLSCAIGDFVRPLTEVEPGKESENRYVPLDESQLNPTLFDVGSNVTFRSSFTGQLICFANDAHTTYWNNVGFVDVTVTRTSWPPVDNRKVYEQSRLPACDSSQVVYEKLSDAKHRLPLCNPEGGGSGWSTAQIESTTASYGSGAPRSVYKDLPEAALNDNSLPKQDT
jgi:hypothetical protein